MRALLADLLVHEGRPVPADRLIDDLWGDSCPATRPGRCPRRSRSSAEPSRTPSPVAAHWSSRARPATRSKVDSVVVRRTAVCRDLVAAGALGEALALWRGPAYADFADEAFVETAVARLTEQRLTPRGALRGADGARRVPVSASSLTLVARAPAAGAAAGVAHEGSVPRWSAERGTGELRGAARLLADELGLDPSPELVALQQSILAQELPERGRRGNLPAQLTRRADRSQQTALERQSESRLAVVGSDADRARRSRQDAPGAGSGGDVLTGSRTASCWSSWRRWHRMRWTCRAR